MNNAGFVILLAGMGVGLFLGVGIGARAWRKKFAALDKAAGAFLCAATDFGKDAQMRRMAYGREVAANLSNETAIKVQREIERQEMLEKVAREKRK